MARITFIMPDGSETKVEAEQGHSVMETAVRNGVAGIAAECGGSCACGTCQVIVAPDWFDRLPEPEEAEAAIIENVTDPQPTTRLSCQIRMTPDLDGLTVKIPASQY